MAVSTLLSATGVPMVSSAEDSRALLTLAGVEAGLSVVNPHLEIVPLRSDSCLSTSKFFLACLRHCSP